MAEIDSPVDRDSVSREVIDAGPTPVPDPDAAGRIYQRTDRARKDGDSLGGVVECFCRGVPPGPGEPVFAKLDGELARARLSLPAAKSFEIGSGFAGTRLSGITHNDEFYVQGDRVRTRSNRSGGIQGGISNGEDNVGRVAFKPIRHDPQAPADGGRGRQ